MDAEFWLDRWEKGQIGFHEREVNAALRAHWPRLGVSSGAKVLVPLCGKSRDMAWLRSVGHPVVGVELSRIAVRDFFAESGLTPVVSSGPRFERWEAGGVTLLAGDLFDLAPDDLQGVAAVYDRAALVALPPALRERYVGTLRRTLPAGARILLLTWSYPEEEKDGPPFSVDEREVERLYGGAFEIAQLARSAIERDHPDARRFGVSSLVEHAFRIATPS